jgi:hypothetical protein
VELYRECGRHVQAGDLLLRVGEDEAALEEYEVAAERLVEGHQDYLGAGELLASKVGRLDLAHGYWARGWAVRPVGSAVACGLRLARLHADTGEHGRLRTLLAEADRFFEPPGNETAAGQFYNEVARLADRDDLAPLRDDLRDCALLGLANKLGQRAESGTRSADAVSRLFGAGAWPAPVVSDAQHAWKAGPRPAEPARPAAVTSVQVGRGTVTAAGFALGTGEIVLGYEDGALACFRPATGEIVYPPLDPSAVPRGYPVRGVAVATGARIIAALRSSPRSLNSLSIYARGADGRYERRNTMSWHGYVATWLAPTILPGERDGVFAAGDLNERGMDHEVQIINELRIIRGPRIVATLDLSACFPDEDFRHGLLLPLASSSQPERVHFLLFARGKAVCRAVVRLGQDCFLETHLCGQRQLPWGPHRLEGTSLAKPILAWWESGPDRVELVGLGQNGTVYWSRLRTEPPLEVEMTNVAVRPDSYLAATLVRSGLVAAVARSSIDWLGAGSGDFRRHTSTKVFLPTAVACFPSDATHELIVVCKDGVVVRVPVPA